jgi:hypothetical protein
MQGDATMTLQEKELLTRFLEQLKEARLTSKDGEAEALIREGAARQPDAAYLLVQRAIQLEQLLAASQAEVQKLKSERAAAPAAAGGTSFLNDNYAWGRQANSGSAPIPGTRQGPLAPPQNVRGMPAAPAQRGSWGGGLFGNIAATAAGVVAGSFLFQGIQGLMNRDEAQTASPGTPPAPEQYAGAPSEPELLNSFDSYEDGGSDTLAGFDDGGDSFS